MTNQNPLGTEKPKQPRYWETSDFWKDAGERVVTGFLIGITTPLTGQQLATGDVNWKVVLIGGGVGAVISTVKAIIGAQRASSTTPVSIF